MNKNQVRIFGTVYRVSPSRQARAQLQFAQSELLVKKYLITLESSHHSCIKNTLLCDDFV